MKTVKWNFNDIAEVAAIEESCFAKPWSQKMLEEEFNNPFFNCLLLKAEDKIIGYLNYHTINGEYHISNIAVVKEHRRKGAASKLLNRLIENAEAENISGITLEVSENNAAAQNLYKSFDFETRGTRKNYYENNVDAVIMWKYIK